MELRSPGIITRISPDQLKTDPELGLALTIADIETLFKVPAEFDIAEYAIVLTPPWLNTKQKRLKQKPLPVLLDGLPEVQAERYSFSAFGLQLTFKTKNTKITKNTKWYFWLCINQLAF